MRSLSPNDLAWFAARLSIAVYDTNQEYRMSVEVKGLADTVRAAREAIGKASTAAARMNDSAGRVVERVSQVEDMIKQLDAAEADLTAAMAAMSNGGPPLDVTAQSAPPIQPGLDNASTIPPKVELNATGVQSSHDSTK